MRIKDTKRLKIIIFIKCKVLSLHYYYYHFIIGIMDELPSPLIYAETS